MANCLSFKKVLVVGMVIALLLSVLPLVASAASVSVVNNVQWTTTSGSAINAHGGSILKVGSYYYWFGENRNSNNSFYAVSCYRSTDLKNWEFRNNVLTSSSASDLNSSKIERPKVVYNAITGKYVMWMHKETASDYSQARAAVASCSTVDGNYTYHGSFKPLNTYMSRDCTLFVDTDNTAYFVSTANSNQDMNVYKLSSDYLSINNLVTTLWAGQSREAPCMFKRNGYYFMVTSGCTGWAPNQVKYSYSSSIQSGWSSLNNIGDSTCYYSQPAYILPIQNASSTTFLYTGDQWAGAWGGSVNDSKYIWLPITFPTNTSLSLGNWYNVLNIDTSAGTISGNNTYFNIVNKKSGKSIAVKDSSTLNNAVLQLATTSSANSQRWRLYYDRAGYDELININSSKLMDVYKSYTTNGTILQQYSSSSGANQKWSIVEVSNGYYKIVSKNSGKVIDVLNSATTDGSPIVQNTYTGSDSQLWKLVP